MWSSFFFFKQKTAYEMRISDWSSDVCSSDLNLTARLAFGAARFNDEIGTRPLDAIGNLQAADHLQLRRGHAGAAHHAPSLHPSGRRNDRDRPDLAPAALFEEQRNVEHDEIARAVAREIGRASCRERVCQYV